MTACPSSDIMEPCLIVLPKDNPVPWQNAIFFLNIFIEV